MYKILCIETGEYLYGYCNGGNIIVYSSQEVCSDWDNSEAVFPTKEDAMKIFSPCTLHSYSDCTYTQFIRLNDVEIPLNHKNRHLFELVEIEEAKDV